MPLFSPDVIGPMLSIVLINLTLSGDNAVVIGMAAHRLPAKQRRAAVIFGAGGAVVIRIVLTAVAALLLQIPFLKLIGGLLLAWIAFNLLQKEEEAAEGANEGASFRQAIQTIIIADFIMSIDNILGVAAAAHGNMPLLLFGLVVSMAIVMLAGSAVATVIDKFWWLVYVGSGVIAWISVEMILTDHALTAFFEGLGLVAEHGELGPETTVPGMALMALCTLVLLAAAHYFHRHRPAQLRSTE
jgi:YjbE family integral membrane protein